MKSLKTLLESQVSSDWKVEESTDEPTIIAFNKDAKLINLYDDEDIVNLENEEDTNHHFSSANCKKIYALKPGKGVEIDDCWYFRIEEYDN